jgi:hypothetical protein
LEDLAVVALPRPRGRPSEGIREVLRLGMPLRACEEWWGGARRKPAARAAFCGLRGVLRLSDDARACGNSGTACD